MAPSSSTPHVQSTVTRPRALAKQKNWRPGHSWKNGKYRYVYLPGHPAAMVNGALPEHRWVLEKKLGRFLLPGMVAHHLNGDGQDNRPENLMELFAFVNLHI